MEVRLVLVAPPEHKRVLFVSLPAVVGRGPESALRIPQESVSRRHCELFASDGAVFIRDLGSTNGTRIGPEKITAGAAIAVESGSVIRVGDVAFRVEYAPLAPQPEAAAGIVVDEPVAVADEADMPEPPVPGAALPDLPPAAVADDLEIEELPVEAEAAAPADMPALPAAFPSTTETVEQPATSFDFIAPDAAPPTTDDTSLDDFLKGLQ
jgi:predicted component of type VI protein secretion system